MGRFSEEKVTSISLSIHSIDELEYLIIKMAKLFTIELKKYTI